MVSASPASREIQHHKELDEFTSLSGKHFLGHSLHAVVSQVPQPLKKEGLLAANCEIYNWEELNRKYNFKVKNDAELLLSFLDKFGIDNLQELDGVYAFAYWKENTLYLARDILGEKPLWFVHNTDAFAFASEKKALEKLGFLDIQELNPRSRIKYGLKENRLEFINREFFSYLPETAESFDILKEKLPPFLTRLSKKGFPARDSAFYFLGG